MPRIVIVGSAGAGKTREEGGLAEAFGLRPTLVAAASGLLIAPLFGALSPLWRVRETPAGEPA